MSGEYDSMVVVEMITYNHGLYIAQAIESVLIQKTSFKFKLLICEDFSTDGTREICIDYKNRFPNLIDLHLNEKNLGVLQNAKKLHATSISCNSKYIAMCEGDDYWTDSYKLQKQVDFLEDNQDFAICFHNAVIVSETSPSEVSYSNPDDQKEVSAFDDLAKGEYIYTATCLFRSDDFKKFPQQYMEYINNYTIDLHNAQFGKIRYFNEVMSAYRIHGGGMWSMVSREKTLVDQLPTYKFYLHYFEKEYKKYFIEHLRNMTSELIYLKLKNGESNLFRFWLYFWNFVYYNFNIKLIKRMGYIFLKGSFNSLSIILGRK